MTQLPSEEAHRPPADAAPPVELAPPAGSRLRSRRARRRRWRRSLPRPTFSSHRRETRDTQLTLRMQRLSRSSLLLLLLHHRPDPPGPRAVRCGAVRVRVRCHRFRSSQEKRRRCSRTDSAGHIIPTAARKRGTHTQGFTHARARSHARRRPFLPRVIIEKAESSRAESSRVAAGCPQPLTAVRLDVAEMWLPVRLAASHLRTQRPHSAPWIEPG